MIIGISPELKIDATVSEVMVVGARTEMDDEIVAGKVSPSRSPQVPSAVRHGTRNWKVYGTPLSMAKKSDGEVRVVGCDAVGVSDSAAIPCAEGPAPAAPVGPVAPVAPVGPLGPVAPVVPVPDGPVGPVTDASAPVAPVGPVGPLGPLGPVGPVGP